MSFLRTLANLFAYPDPWEASTRNQITKDARNKRRELQGHTPARHLSADDFMDDPRPASLLTVNTTGHDGSYAEEGQRNHG